MEIRNAKYNKDGSIDIEFNHPKHGWIPFTASKLDVELHGRELFKELESGVHGNVEPYKE